jgi:hypothetical protein
LSQVFIIFLGRNNSFLGGLRLIECWLFKKMLKWLLLVQVRDFSFSQK